MNPERNAESAGCWYGSGYDGVLTGCTAAGRNSGWVFRRAEFSSCF